MSDGAARQQFFERCPAPAAIVGFDGAVEEANGAWHTVAGLRREEMVGRSLAELLHPDDIVPSLEDPQALRSGALAGTWEGRLLGRDGSAVWLSWDVSVSHEGQRYFCVARRLAVEELRRQERFKVDFINMAAHELNTPLTPIELALDTLSLRIEPALGPDAHQSVEMVRRNFLRFKELVGELIDAARIHAGSLPLELKEVDLSVLAMQAIGAKAEAAAESGRELRARVEPDLRAVADPNRLLQVLGSYLACGLACAPAGEQVRLDVERHGQEAVVAVTSRGATLTADQRARLFLPFPPGDDPVPHPRVGTGLGLYMSRGIIELHGGRVAAHEGEGLMLSFVLPLEGPAPPAPAAQPARVGPEAVAS